MESRPTDIGGRTRERVAEAFVGGVLIGAAAVVAPLVALVRKVLDDARRSL